MWELRNKKGENPKNYKFTTSVEALAFLKKMKAKAKLADKNKSKNAKALLDEVRDLRLVEIKDA